MTDAELIMYGITIGALLLTTGVMIGAIILSKFGNNTNIREDVRVGDRAVGEPTTSPPPVNTSAKESDSPPSTGEDVLHSPSPVLKGKEKKPMPFWRQKRAEKKEKHRESIINLGPVVEQVEADSIIIDLERANNEDVEAVLVEKDILVRPRCATCNKLAKSQPANDGKHYCKTHAPEELLS